jgi:hypothetical protein
MTFNWTEIRNTDKHEKMKKLLNLNLYYYILNIYSYRSLLPN